MKKISIIVLFLLFTFSQSFGNSINIIGDSLIVGSSEYLRSIFETKAYIDAKIGRHFEEAFEIIRNLEERNSLGQIVVVNLTNNSAVSYESFEKLLNYLKEKGRSVIFVNTHVPKSWRDYNNQNLNKLIKNRKDFYLVDWYDIFNAVCHEHSCLRKDGVHLTKEGSLLYAYSISFAIWQALKEKALYAEGK